MRYLLAISLRAVTGLQVALDMAALFGAAKLQLARQAIVRAIYRRQ